MTIHKLGSHSSQTVDIVLPVHTPCGRRNNRAARVFLSYPQSTGPTTTSTL